MIASLNPPEKYVPELAVNASIPKDILHCPVIRGRIKKDEVGRIEPEVCFPDGSFFFLFPPHPGLLLFRKSGKMPVIYDSAGEAGRLSVRQEFDRFKTVRTFHQFFPGKIAQRVSPEESGQWAGGAVRGRSCHGYWVPFEEGESVLSQEKR